MRFFKKSAQKHFKNGLFRERPKVANTPHSAAKEKVRKKLHNYKVPRIHTVFGHFFPYPQKAAP